MKKCSKCNYFNPDAQNVCLKCKADLNADPPKNSAIIPQPKLPAPALENATVQNNFSNKVVINAFLFSILFTIFVYFGSWLTGSVPFGDLKEVLISSTIMLVVITYLNLIIWAIICKMSNVTKEVISATKEVINEEIDKQSFMEAAIKRDGKGFDVKVPFTLAEEFADKTYSSDTEKSAQNFALFLLDEYEKKGGNYYQHLYETGKLQVCVKLLKDIYLVRINLK